MSNPLKFYLGEESHHIVESYDEKDSSLFADQYNKALGIIEHYIYAQEGHNGDKQGNLRNNIVAFLGDRGTGKTSCMLSVLNMLDKHFEKKNFAKIDTIDPSFFDENTNILFLVIGKMFATFKKDMESTDSRMGRKNQEIHDLTKTFHDVQSCLSRMQKSPLDDNDNDMNQLSNLLVTVDLTEKLKELVNNYLKFFGSDYLVVPIDDIDNNTQHAYTMAEQLRKYLVLPKVIILISFKLEQLVHVIDLHFTKMYEPLIKQNQFNSEGTADMTQKYLLKLIPLNQRVTLPNMEVMMDRELEVYKSREEKSIEQGLSKSSVKYTMTALIFRKTRYLFYHSTGETCPIVPTNLREYRTLLSMLCNMEDYLDKKVEYNKTLFRRYFYGDWIDKHLDEKGKKIARTLIENEESSSFNKLVLSNLSNLISGIPEFQELLMEEDNDLLDNRQQRRTTGIYYTRRQFEFQLVVTNDNSTYNISIGDVFAVLREIKSRVVEEKDKMLLFFIESLYSIKLYHYYDEITEQDLDKKSTNNSIDTTIKRLDILEDVSNYEKLIGGDFFNPNMLRLLPMENKTNISRAYRVVNLNPIRNLLDKLNRGENISDLEFQTIEFYALTLSRRLYSKTKGDVYPLYRRLQEVYYLSDLNNAQKAVFDLGTFFSNITKIKYAYNRLCMGFFKIANERPNSLLNKLHQKTKEHYSLENYNNFRFLSWCCIRNAVILQDFGDSFSYIKTGRTTSSDQLQLLQDFFKEVSDYKIKTYDKTDNNDAYTISFDYAKVFVEYFSEMQKNDEAKTLFYNVFGDINIEEKINLNIDDILNNCKNLILKETLKTRIIKNNPELKDNAEFWRNFDSMIVTTKISKEPARQVLEYLKKQFGY